MVKSIGRFALLLIFICLFLPNIILAQANYNNPESAVYDPVNNCYYISNTGDGKIIKVDADDTTSRSVLNSDLTSVRGLCIIGNMLIAAANEGVVYIALPAGTVIQTVVIPGMGFLNDICSDGSDILFVSDTGTGNIYKLIMSGDSYETLASGLSSPNGLCWDGDNSRLIFVPMINNAPIMAVNMGDRSVQQIRATTLHQPDGITRDMFGNYYISYWTDDPNGSDGFVVRAPSDFSGDAWDLISSGHSGPADIFFRETASTGKIRSETDVQENSGILVIPNWNVHTVTFLELTNLSYEAEEISQPPEFQLNQNFPNPFNPNTTISYQLPVASDVTITIYDISGRVVRELANGFESAGYKSVLWDGRDENGQMVSGGVYIYYLRAGNYHNSQKMLLMK